MIEIPLLPSGAAIVDDEFASLSEYTWRLHTAGYAYRRTRSKTIYMHREILDLLNSPGLQADHINRNRLDNRCANLRVVTNRENGQNRPAHSGRYRGVHFSQQYQRWIAKTKLNYKPVQLGAYKTEIEAARAAEAFRRVHLPHSVPDDSLGLIPDCPCRECRGGRGEHVVRIHGGKGPRYDVQIKQMLELGWAVIDIAGALGVNRSCVQRSIKRQGLAFPPSRRHARSAA